MRRSLTALVLCLSATVASAQAPSTPAPDASIATSALQRVVVIRLRNGTDLLTGLKEAVAREKIANGVILGAFGSVTSYHVHVVDNTTFPPKDVFTRGEGPYDLLNVSGLVLNGRLHPHVMLASPTKVVGGHLEEGTKVFTFANISIGVLSESIDLSRNDDWNWH